MVDSTAAYERRPDTPSFPLVGTVERTVGAAGHGADSTDGASAEHASALLQMGAAKQEAGAYSEAEDLFRRALEIGERALGPDSPALVPAMTSLASARIMAGRLDDAEPLVLRALEVSESGPIQNDPDLAIVLNELARLCLKQSAYALAEPLLLRMYALKRSKGEDHPEVATVLASLATVRQALGRHESAEQLWRRVLEIRERTLAPNHFALATTLEHLGEACAARGKISEALQLLQRAQTIRELTLGAGHQSVRTARDRIADLQLEAEGSLDSVASDAPALPPERYRLLSADNSAVSAAPAPPARERSNPAPRKGAARVIEQEVPAPAIDRGLAAKAEFTAVATAPSVVDAATATGSSPAEPAEPVNFRDVIMSIKQELEDGEESTATTSRAAEFIATAVAAVKQRQKATVIGVGVIALLVVLATVSRAFGDSAVVGAAVAGPTPGGTNPTSTIPTTEATDRAAALPIDLKAPATAEAPAIPVATSSRARVVEQRAPAKKTPERPERKVEAGSISIPKLPTALASNLDSIVQARSTAARGIGGAFTGQQALENGSGQRLSFGRDEAADAPRRAQLIGALPSPRYPAQLSDIEGEVRVRFQVDTDGRPVPSSISVVRSSDPLFTAATLKVIPGLRFEPARSGGADSKAVTDIVQIGFQFRPGAK